MTRTNREMVQIFFSFVHHLRKKTLGSGILQLSNCDREYSFCLLLETYIKDANVKHKLFNAIENIPCVTRKAKWAINWIATPLHLQSLLAFSCVGGIFFF